MTMKKVLWNRWFWLIVGACGLLWVGYGSLGPPKLYPVSGTVTLDGEPLVPNATPDGKPLELDIQGLSNRSGYIVCFEPDHDKGNRSFMIPKGYLDRKGRYQLQTDIPLGSSWPVERHEFRISEGAPLGWYKVTIGAVLAVPEADIAKIRKYYGLNEKATSFSIKVVKNPEPGRYDIKLESDNLR